METITVKPIRQLVLNVAKMEELEAGTAVEIELPTALWHLPEDGSRFRPKQKGEGPARALRRQSMTD